MQPISNVVSGAAQLSSSVVGVKEAAKPEIPRDEAQGRPLKPVMDEYIPEEKQEPTGRYWLSTDEDGNTQINFDNPERSRSEEADSTTCDTGAVDREIERLKKEQEQLEQQISSETDGEKIKELGKKLAQIERELSQKDNDTYRRQHAVFS